MKNTIKEQGSAQIIISLKNGNITTCNADGRNKNVYKKVNDGTWNDLYDHIQSLLDDASNA